MSDKLVPQNPEEVMVIRDVLPGITTFSVPFARFGRVKIGGRATIVKLSSGSLAVFSPVALTPTVKARVSSLGGKVSYLIAPDYEHHIFLSAWHDAYPSARVIAPEGLDEKRANLAHKDERITNIQFSTIFSRKKALAEQSGEVAPTRIDEDDFDKEFEYEYVHAHVNKELVFFHKPSRTLIEADLLFNLPATEQYSLSKTEDATSGWATRIFGALQNTRGSAIWQKRLLWYAVSSSDREGFNNSIKRINTWGFENIVPCHGDTIVGSGKGVFEKVFEWHIKAAKPQK